MKFESFGAAHDFGVEKRKQAQDALPKDAKFEYPREWLEGEEVEHLIDLQFQSWGKDNSADYGKYAQTLWEEVFEEAPKGEAFEAFKGELILRLHRIPIDQHVYRDVKENLPELVKIYGSKVRKIALWSTGDISHAAFQIAKVERSRIVGDFYRGLRAASTTADAKRFMDEKTEYLVDDDKLARLEEYLEQLTTEENEVKVVIIEDTPRNFDVAQRMAEKLQKKGRYIRIVPIWAGYSRYARRGREMAEARGGLATFEAESKARNSIQSFGELLDEERFEEIFKDAHVLVDFDGVIVNDDTRRQAQTEAVYGALVSAGKHRGVDEKDVLGRIGRSMKRDILREIEDPHITEILPSGNVAILRGSKERGTEQELYKRGVKAVVYIDGMNIGAARSPEGTLRMDHPEVRALVKEKGEEDLWFAHPLGFLYCHGSRKVPATNFSKVDPAKLAHTVDRLLHEE